MDLQGIVSPRFSVDEYAASMGDDADVITLAFKVRGKDAASDLELWFERGYFFVIDAQVSDGELVKGIFVVFVEMERRTRAATQINELLDDLYVLTGIELDGWQLSYDEKLYKWDMQQFSDMVPLSPKAYRELHFDEEAALQEMKNIAGI
jgi:hypothetical protein